MRIAHKGGDGKDPDKKKKPGTRFIPVDQTQRDLDRYLAGRDSAMAKQTSLPFIHKRRLFVPADLASRLFGLNPFDLVQGNITVTIDDKNAGEGYITLSITRGKTEGSLTTEFRMPYANASYLVVFTQRRKFVYVAPHYPARLQIKGEGVQSEREKITGSGAGATARVCVLHW